MKKPILAEKPDISDVKFPVIAVPKGGDWELFKLQAIRAVGLEGHHSAEEAYIRAWENGHEGGKDEVLCHLYDLAESILEGE